MLTIEEIKKAVDFADGFECGKDEVYYRNADFEISFPTIESFVDSGYYDLFLDRVIQGLNRKEIITDLMIISHAKSIEVIHIKNDKEEYHIFRHNGTTVGIREAREKAIRFVLKEL